jgi:nicotinamidase-related amidase
MEHEVDIFQAFPLLVPSLLRWRAMTLSSHGDGFMTTTFAPENSALLLIDHQVGTMQLIKNIDVEQAKRMSLALAQTANILGIPTVMTSIQEDHIQGPLMPELKDILPEAFEKRVKREGIVNAWTDTNFKAAVEATGRKNLIMAGATTDVCLVFLAIDAVGEGYSVQAVLDASGSPFELSEDMSRRRMQDAGVVLTATNTMIAELAQNWVRQTARSLSNCCLPTCCRPSSRKPTPSRLPPRRTNMNTVATPITGTRIVPPETHQVRAHGPFQLRKIRPGLGRTAAVGDAGHGVRVPPRARHPGPAFDESRC